jgi:hypothetical protein
MPWWPSPENDPIYQAALKAGEALAPYVGAAIDGLTSGINMLISLF